MEPRLLPVLRQALGPWATDAACLSADPDTFFPDKGGSIEPARRICQGDTELSVSPCPVRSQCLEYALANDQNEGVWGGMSARERRRLSRRTRPDRRTIM